MGGHDLTDRSSASYPDGIKGPGIKSPWRQKLYNCNCDLYLLLKYRLKMAKKELSVGEPTFKKKKKKKEIKYLMNTFICVFHFD